MASEQLSFADAFPENAEQAAYWNVDISGKWVDNQAALDLRFQAITDRLIERAEPGAGERILDVGCGTGATLLALAARTGKGGRVLGVDISQPMLEVAGRRVRQAGLHQVELRCADAQSHRFEPRAFDLLTSRFGVMFFSEPVRAFANLEAALVPGGRLVFVCWTEVEGNPWFSLPLAAAVRRLGPPEQRDPRAPGPFAFADGDYVRSVLGSAGFEDIVLDRTEVLIETPASCEEEAAFASYMGPAARLIRERSDDPEAMARTIGAEITEAFRPFAVEGGIRLPAVVWMVSARRPPSPP